MTSHTTSATRRQSGFLARILAFVLLAFVFYTTTAEAVHKHSNLSLAPVSGAATAVYSSGDTSSSANDPRSIGECVICQLRQQLSISLLNALPETGAAQQQTTLTHVAALTRASRFATPQRGRAPPLASLI